MFEYSQSFQFVFVVVPEVEITANSIAVLVSEDDVIINCFILRGNPMNYAYSITHVDSGNIVLDSLLTLTDIQVADLGTYLCNVTNDAGTGSASVAIEQGGKILRLI